MVAYGGLNANDSYDAAGRYSGSINWVRSASIASHFAPVIAPRGAPERCFERPAFRKRHLHVMVTHAVKGRFRGCPNSTINALQAGDIFPAMHNFKRGHRATSIGTQLLSNYRKYLAAYERSWAAVDLPMHPLPPVPRPFSPEIPIQQTCPQHARL